MLDSCNECVFCDYFKGDILTPNVQSDEYNLEQGKVQFFKFNVQDGVYYYFTATNFDTDQFDLIYDYYEIGQFEIGFGEADTTFPDADGVVYLKYTADVAVANARITLHECTPDAYGFSTANGHSHYVGRTITVGQEIEIPQLEIGEKYFFRFEVVKDSTHKYGCRKESNLSITNEIAFYVKEGGEWQIESLTWVEGQERLITHTPDVEVGKTYCYVVITSNDGDTAGTFSMVCVEILNVE